MKPVIQVNHLIKRYKKETRNAVNDLSFEVFEGELFAFLGPNGAGKTTTISILTTTLIKTSGEVKIAGFDIERDPTKVRDNIGVIFQKPSLDQNLTAEENIRFHAILYGLYRFNPTFSLMPESYRRRVLELSTILGIENEIFKPIRNFSGGMKRKLEIVRSLMQKPKILFLDEPTSGLDPLSRKNLWDYLQKVRQEEKTTIFLTTHYLEEAENADRVCIVDKGRIVVIGTPKNVKEELIDEYLLINSKKRDLLRHELNDLNVKFEEGEYFKVYLKGKSIQKIINRLTVDLNVLQIHTPSLEDAYLELIEMGEKR